MGKNEENWLTFFSELQAYIEAHGHLPDKHVVESRGLLSKVRYLHMKVKAGRMGKIYVPEDCRDEELYIAYRRKKLKKIYYANEEKE